MDALVQEEVDVAKRVVLAKGLAFARDIVTQTVAILARKGAGKSFTLRRIAEQLCKAGEQVVIADPKGDQWGIRSAADGKGPGLGFIILGGEHGDLPLEVGSGELVARLVVEERVSVVLDLSLFRKNEVATFMAAFLENLYRLKAREVYRTPVMLLLDEADAVAPQKPFKGEERMLGAIEDIVRRGRQRGIGCTLVTQRSAVLNKNVLTQAQVMIAMRTIAPQDLAAMDAWIDVHGTPKQRERLMESLPSLPVGDAWVWSPGWPTDAGIFHRVHVEPIETFDSGATPKPGERRVEPRERADVDLEVLRRQMAATVERAEKTDPKRLQRRVAELERELAKKAPPPAPADVEPKVVEKPVLKDAQVKRLEALGERAEKAAILFAEAVREVRPAMLRAIEAAASVRPITIQEARARPERPFLAPPPRPAAPPRAAPARREQANGADEPISGYAMDLVRTLASREPMGLTKSQLALLAGKSPTSGGYFAALAELRRGDAIAKDGRMFRLTPTGRALLGTEVPAASTPAEVRDHWRRALPEYERIIFETLEGHYPRPLSKIELAEQSGKSATSGGYFAALATLRRNEIMVKRDGGFVMNDTLADGAAA